uniref:Ras family protein n=1 Tax=Strongyloides papillosus TaxID=174720 RepID=A0A0N5C841_STREA
MFNNEVRCIVYGQQHIGKASFILKYLNLPIEHQNVPCKESFVKTELLDNQIICLSIKKISKEEDLTNEEILKSDICILTFAVNDPISFAYIINGKSLISRHKPDMPLIILATKSDLRSSTLTNASCIDISRVHTFVSEIGAYGYFETSIFLNDESSLLFRQAIKIIKLVDSYNESMKPQTISPLQKLFSSVKNIWEKANYMVKQQTVIFNQDNNVENYNNKVDAEKYKLEDLNKETEYNKNRGLLSSLSVTDLSYIDINENSGEKETFV